MSLINKMLQDLDARGSQSGASLQAEIKPVMAAEPRLPVRQIALGAGVLVLAMAAGAWWWIKKPATATPRPLAMGAPAAAPLPPATAVVTAPVVPLPAPKEDKVVAAPTAAEPAKHVVRTTPVAARPRIVPPPKVQEPVAPAVLPAAAGGRNMNDGQRAERQYREAIGLLDEGRVSAAMEALEQTLKLNPRHEGARQSLVNLLIEGGRKDDAMQQLEQGLERDPAQAQMAMLLARLQIERGQSGVLTLMRSLPAVAGNADFHAFLAGALQREGRQREAVEQYALALRSNPEQGVWLMGMGISLQAEQRNAEARQAFLRARDSRTLTTPLQEFVERKLQQLGQ
jgi:MSHA biogenesis protein MshN